MLRGVWGAALHQLDQAAYGKVFRPPATNSGESVPLYVLRPATTADGRPAIDWISIGPALDHDAILLRAWLEATRMGLGPQRLPFTVESVGFLAPHSRPEEPWSLNSIAPGLDPDQPWQITFTTPLRLRRKGLLIERPTLVDIIVAATRRIYSYLTDQPEVWVGIKEQALVEARATPASPWVGQRLDLRRYSGSQKAELEMRGVSGSLTLPVGPGKLWPWLEAARWLHLGSGTVFGMGQVLISRPELQP